MHQNELATNRNNLFLGLSPKINNNLLHINRFLLSDTRMKSRIKHCDYISCSVAKNLVLFEIRKRHEGDFSSGNFLRHAHTSNPYRFSHLFSETFPSIVWIFSLVVLVTAIIFTKHFIANTTGFIQSRDSKESRRDFAAKFSNSWCLKFYFFKVCLPKVWVEIAVENF